MAGQVFFRGSGKTNVPAEPSSPAGAKWGVGVRHALFPGLALGARIGCQLPDAILHGKRSLRPRSRAGQRLAAAELLSEAFQLAWAGGCATGPQTWSRHNCDCGSASCTLSTGLSAAHGSVLAQCY